LRGREDLRGSLRRDAAEGVNRQTGAGGEIAETMRADGAICARAVAGEDAREQGGVDAEAAGADKARPG
jgi:hypothetical protein